MKRRVATLQERADLRPHPGRGRPDRGGVDDDRAKAAAHEGVRLRVQHGQARRQGLREGPRPARCGGAAQAGGVVASTLEA